ncbi:hypothetical protein U9M48_002846, partial [Paspalum notatum var. saurae]
TLVPCGGGAAPVTGGDSGCAQQHMDRSWINTRLFGKAHLDGVNEFMKFVSERFGEDAEILCPCRRCLNRIRTHKGQAEDHLYIYGMASTYSRWIYHGESLDAETY